MSLGKALGFFPLVTLVSSFVWAPPVLEPKPEDAPEENAERDLVTRAVNALSIADISSYAPSTWFARAVYCDPTKIKTWTCGGEYFDRFTSTSNWILICETRTLALDACSANPDFQPTLAGGNGANVPYCAL